MRHSLLAPLSILLAIGAASSGCGAGTDRSSESEVRAEATDETPPETEIGAPARAYVEGSERFFLATDRETVDELVDVQNAADVDGLRRLTRKGKVFNILNNSDVVVVERSGRLTKVRATEHDRGYTGPDGWARSEFVQPVRRDEDAASRLPEYTVVDKVGDHLLVLTPTLNADTPASEVEAVARDIAAAEGVGSVHLYMNMDAFRPNREPSSGMDANVLYHGYIGALERDEFSPPEW